VPGRVDESQDPEELTRRNFIKIGIGALSLLAALEVAGASMLFLRSRGLEAKFGGVVTAGPVDTFPPGSVTEFPDGRFFLIRSLDGGFLAVHSRCPHLGCAVHWAPDENRFLCPCHASSFDLYGSFESAPVSRALDAFPVTIEDTTVRVNTAKLERRDHFVPEQLTYA
jgi:cytochrome b6-f complex iron-sulfur subunit